MPLVFDVGVLGRQRLNDDVLIPVVQDYLTHLSQASPPAVYIVEEVSWIFFPLERSGCQLLVQTPTQFLDGGVVPFVEG